MKNESNFVKQVDDIIGELKKFSSRLCEFSQPVISEYVDRFEDEFEVKLPNDYKYLLAITNGFSLMGDRILGITWSDYGDDLCSVYKYEHNDVLIPQYKHLVPFCPDGGGNFYCFDTQVSTNGGNSNRIVFWCSNYNYTESDIPEITHNCLADFINECIIGWTLEDYDYEGHKK